jgi:hypothetical protein
MDATSIASMIDPQEDDYMLSAKMPAQFPREIPQMKDDKVGMKEVDSLNAGAYL